MSSGVPEVTPAPPLAPVVLRISQSRCIVTIDFSHFYKNGFVFMTVGRYPLSSVNIFRAGQPNHDSDQKTSVNPLF